MHNRQISAYSGWPSLEYLMELEAASDSCEVIDTSNSCHTPVKEEDAGKKGKLTRRRRSSNSKRSIGKNCLRFSFLFFSEHKIFPFY